MRQKEKDTWTRVSELGEFCAATLTEFGVPLETARGYIARWERDRMIALLRQGGDGTLIYAPLQRVASPDGAKPFAITPENNMWTAMRGLREFTAADLAAYASNGGIDVSEATAKTYLTHLLDAGYLKVLRRAIPGRRPAQYRLLRNTGPFGPCVKRVKVLADPNTEAVSVYEEASIWQRF